MVDHMAYMSVITVEGEAVIRLKDGQEFVVGNVSWDVPVTIVAGHQRIEIVGQKDEDDVDPT